MSTITTQDHYCDLCGEKKDFTELEPFRIVRGSCMAHATARSGDICNQCWHTDGVIRRFMQKFKRSPSTQDAQAAMAMLAGKSKDWQDGWWTARRQSSQASERKDT